MNEKSKAEKKNKMQNSNYSPKTPTSHGKSVACFFARFKTVTDIRDNPVTFLSQKNVTNVTKKRDRVVTLFVTLLSQKNVTREEKRREDLLPHGLMIRS